MAILKGFPPSNVVDPSVQVAECSSYITVRDSFHKPGLVGFASKGPLNQVTSIKTVKQLHDIFGNPHPELSIEQAALLYAAEQCLLMVPEVLIVRVDDGTTKTASVIIESESGQPAMTILADSPGIDGNETRVVVINDPRGDTFTLSIYNSGILVESWSELTKNPQSRYYVESFIDLVSNWVKVKDNQGCYKTPKNGIYTLSGGTDVLPNTEGKLLADQILINGIKLFANEDIEIDLISVPGWSSSVVISELLNLCENERRDCFAIIDPPNGLSPYEVLMWKQGKHNLNNKVLDSEFGAIYYPWVKITDTYNRTDIFVPPSGAVIAAIARSDELLAPWYPATGEIRGIVPGILDISECFTEDEYNLVNRNINIIIPVGDCFMLIGQATLNGSPVNTRRTLLAIEKQIRRMSQGSLNTLDITSDKFKQRFVQICEQVLGQVKEGQGINNYMIFTNELSAGERNEFRTKISIQPINRSSRIYIEFMFSNEELMNDDDADETSRIQNKFLKEIEKCQI